MKLSKNLLIAAFFICLQPALVLTVIEETSPEFESLVHEYKSGSRQNLRDEHAEEQHLIDTKYSEKAKIEHKAANQAKKDLEIINLAKKEPQPEGENILQSKKSNLFRYQWTKEEQRTFAQRADSVMKSQEILDRIIPEEIEPKDKRPMETEAKDKRPEEIKLKDPRPMYAKYKLTKQEQRELGKIPTEDIRYLDFLGDPTKDTLDILIKKFTRAYPGKPLPENLQDILIIKNRSGHLPTLRTEYGKYFSKDRLRNLPR